MRCLRIHKASKASDRTSTSFGDHARVHTFTAAAWAHVRPAIRAGLRRPHALEMERRRLGAATTRLVSAIERDGAAEVAHGKADDEAVCKYLIFLQRRCEHACVRVSGGFRQRFAGPPRSGSRRITGAQMQAQAGVCSPSIPMAALLERLASTSLLSIPDPFFDTATRAPRPAKDCGRLAF